MKNNTSIDVSSPENGLLFPLFTWDTSMTVLNEFIIMIIVIKIVYVFYDYLSTMISGNYYKHGTNFVTRHLYKNKLPFHKVLTIDNPSTDILQKRKASLQELAKRFKKYNYGKENGIKSTDSKLNPKCSMYIPSVFGSILDEYDLSIPHLWKGYDDETGYKLIDYNDNKLFDLSSGNGVNIIGNKKVKEITDSVNAKPFGSGFSSVETQSAVNNLLAIFNKDRKEKDGDKIYDNVSFSESGSAAVISCIKQCRFYHYKYGDINRNRIVCFKNAYHGWIINPYIGTNNPDPNLVVLNALDIPALKYIINNYLKIAAIFVDPMKILSVNKIYPRESLTIGKRDSFINSEENKQLFIRWMRKIDDICKSYQILLVMDECYSGFRIGPYGATQEYKLNPDMIILSKQLGCGLNTTAIVGVKQKMLRKKDIAQVVFTTGTGTTNPQHHGLVNKFCQYALTSEYVEIHENKTIMFNKWCLKMNAKFSENNLPLKLNNYYNTFTLDININSYYNWMLVLKLISYGCVFTPGGATKFTVSFDYDENGLKELGEIFIKSGLECIDEGWFYEHPLYSKMNILKGTILHNIYQYIYLFFYTIHMDKVIDVGVSHNHPVNRWTHFWSSLGQIFISYPLWVFYNYKFESMVTFLVLHVLRQTGHFFYEAQLKHDEKVKIGYKNATKKKVAALIPIGIVLCYVLSTYYPDLIFFMGAKKLFVLMGLLSIVNRMVDISQNHGWLRTFCWFIKILTDPFTDLWDFYDCWNPLDKKMDFSVDWDKIEKNKQFYPLEF